MGGATVDLGGHVPLTFGARVSGRGYNENDLPAADSLLRSSSFLQYK